MKKTLAILTALALLLGLLGGCASQNSPTATPSSGGAGTTDGTASGSDGTESTEPTAQEADEMLTNRDKRTDYDAADSISVTLNGSTATVNGDGVSVDGSTVTFTAAGTYVITGTLSDGMLLVDAPEDTKLQLVFCGVSITSASSAALYIRQADKVFVTLAEGTGNTLANGGVFTAVDDNNIDGAVFSKEDLSFNGSGTLTVTSPAGHGIVCKDDLVLAGGVYAITSASHAIDANDSVRVTDSTLTLDAGKDGIHADNDEDTEKGFVYVESGTFTIEAEGDGISASVWVQLDGGEYEITAGGGNTNGTKHSSSGWGQFGGRPGQQTDTQTDTDSTSMKGIKAGTSLLIRGGSFTIDSADDSLHCNGSAVIEDGSFTLSTGDDGIHADEALSVSGGTITILTSYEGMEALHLSISGGDIKITASDDGLNAAGGADSSGFGGRDNGQFGDPGSFGGGHPGGMGGQTPPSGDQGGQTPPDGQPGGDGGNPGGMGSSNGTIVISGGTLFINAGGDGIDSNGSLTITGGKLEVYTPTQGDTATLDYDTTGTITGGIFLGSGATGMAQTLTGSGQGVLTQTTGNQSAGTTVSVADTQGNVLVSFTPNNPFGIVIISLPGLIAGESYVVTVGNDGTTVTAK